MTASLDCFIIEAPGAGVVFLQTHCPSRQNCPFKKIAIMSKPKILLADEARLFTELGKQFLKQTAAEIVVARSSTEVLELSRAAQPALIYLAFSLAGDDGAACCRALKADRALGSIPVVLIGDGSRERELAICRDAGADGLLTKPIERRSFLDLGRRFLPSIERRELRIPCRTSVFFSLQGQNGYGTLVDLSAGGLFIQYSRPVQVESRVQLNFVIPGRTSDVVGACGRVAWTNESLQPKRSDLPAGFGVEFLDLPAESARVIQAFLASQAS